MRQFPVRRTLGSWLGRTVTLTLVATVLATLAVSPALAGKAFKLDGGHTDLGFSADHFGVSRMSGWFGTVSGAMMMEEDMSQSSVEINVDTASLIATDKGRADALKSPVFLDVAKFPAMTFKSTKFEKKGDAWMVTGDLTIRDVTRSVSFPFSVKGPRPDPMGNERMGVAGSFTIDRREFGITFDRAMQDGTPLVGNEIRIDIVAEFTHRAE